MSATVRTSRVQSWAVGAQGGLVGVAPQAKLLMGKVCVTEGCSSIAIADGINWAAEEKVVDVVNMSLGGALLHINAAG